MCKDVSKQEMGAMDIFDQHYSDEDHVFIFDNAMAHLKWVDDVLSA